MCERNGVTCDNQIDAEFTAFFLISRATVKGTETLDVLAAEGTLAHDVTEKADVVLMLAALLEDACDLVCG